MVASRRQTLESLKTSFPEVGSNQLVHRVDNCESFSNRNRRVKIKVGRSRAHLLNPDDLKTLFGGRINEPETAGVCWVTAYATPIRVRAVMAG